MGTNRLRIITVAAVAVSSVAVGSHFVSGASERTETVFVPITPCRLVDSRPNTTTIPTINVGPRNTKLGAAEVATFTAWGSGDGNSPCDIPNTATALATNAVAVQPTTRSFLTLYPGDVENPGTSNLNYEGGQAPTPNSANIPLSPTGTFNVFNAFGTVHVIIDVNGYYQPSSTVGDSGPAGPTGPSGASLFDRTIVVKGSSSDAENGAALLAAVTSAAAGSPSASNPWLIKLEPGVFDLGGARAELPRHVSISGSGTGLSEVRSAIRSNSGVEAAVIVARTGTTVSDLAIRNVGGSGTGNFAVGIYAGSVTIHDVRIEVSGTGSPKGVTFEVGAKIDATRLEITATGTSNPSGFGNAATSNTTSEIRLTDSQITASTPTPGPGRGATAISIVNGVVFLDGVELVGQTPLNVASSTGKSIDLELRNSKLTSVGGTRSLGVFTNGTTNATLRYVELSHVTELDEATTTDCKATIRPGAFLDTGCPI